MDGSHDMRHTVFSQVDGGQRDPQEMGRLTTSKSPSSLRSLTFNSMRESTEVAP